MSAEVVVIKEVPCDNCEGRGYILPEGPKTSPFHIHRRHGGAPGVKPRKERHGRRTLIYRDEFSWQEDRRSDFTAASDRMQPSLLDAMRDTGEIDEQVSPAAALRRVREWLPLRTVEDLFLATAWQPFKAILFPNWVGYTVPVIDVWARARAEGKPAPWEERSLLGFIETEERDLARFAKLKRAA